MAGIQIDGTNYKLVLDADADTYLETATDDTIKVYVSGTNQITIKDGAISPVTDNDIDLGTNSLEFKDGYFDGTLHCDVLDLAGTEHTSISSPITALNNATANELVTVGATTTELDAESGLTYTDGALVIGGTTPSLTIGDAGAEDTKIVFDGNAQDYHIGLDDSSDDLVIGLGSALGTTTHMSFDEAGHVKMPLTCAVHCESNADVANCTGDGSDVKLTYQTEHFDQNGDFSSQTFTAPVTGRYLITFTTAIAGLGSGHDLTMWLETSNNNYLNQINLANVERNNEYYDLCAQIVDMDASDTATVNITVGGGSKTIDTNAIYQYFGAVLLC